MARVTVEDCSEHVDNQFELTLIASKRARQLVRGADAKVAWDTDKSTVVALREVADGLVDKSILEEEDLPLNIPSRAPLVPMEPETEL